MRLHRFGDKPRTRSAARMIAPMWRQTADAERRPNDRTDVATNRERGAPLE